MIHKLSTADAALLRAIRDSEGRTLRTSELDEAGRRRASDLRAAGLIRQRSEAYIGSGPDGVTLTPAGLDSLAAYEDAQQRAEEQARDKAAAEEWERASTEKSAKGEWIRFWINAVLSVAALVVAVIALLK